MMRDEQWEDIKRVWYNQSTWGRRRKRRIFWSCVAAGAVIGILLGIFAR